MPPRNYKALSIREEVYWEFIHFADQHEEKTNSELLAELLEEAIETDD